MYKVDNNLFIEFTDSVGSMNNKDMFSIWAADRIHRPRNTQAMIVLKERIIIYLTH